MGRRGFAGVLHGTPDGAVPPFKRCGCNFPGSPLGVTPGDRPYGHACLDHERGVVSENRDDVGPAPSSPCRRGEPAAVPRCVPRAQCVRLCAPTTALHTVRAVCRDRWPRTPRGGCGLTPSPASRSRPSPCLRPWPTPRSPACPSPSVSTACSSPCWRTPCSVRHPGSSSDRRAPCRCSWRRRWPRSRRREHRVRHARGGPRHPRRRRLLRRSPHPPRLDRRLLLAGRARRLPQRRCRRAHLRPARQAGRPVQ